MTDYISREWLLAEYDRRHKGPPGGMRAIIEEAPAADVREVKRGKWVDDKGLYRCSACGHLWSELWWTANFPIERMLKTMPFCPNCGADMRKEEENVSAD